MKRLILIAMVVLLSASMAPAQDICESDFDCNGAVDADDVGTFVEDFGRSEFFNPCPPCVPLDPVLKTGQTGCWDGSGNPISCAGTGQDGEYQLGFSMFTDHGDDTVTDKRTGLIWLKDANCFGLRTWINALADFNGLTDGQCGLTDGSNAGEWRLPNARELKSIYDSIGYYDGMQLEPHPFVNVQFGDYWYWSSTTNGPHPHIA